MHWLTKDTNKECHGDMRSITWPHYSTTIPYISSSKFSANLRAFATLLGKREQAHHYVTALMKFLYVCMYVCTVVIPYYVLIQNYMTTSVQ